jgi:hypothetical protein
LSVIAGPAPCCSRRDGCALRAGSVYTEPLSIFRRRDFGTDRRSSGTRLIEISDDNFGAFATEGARDLPAYAARRAGNNGDLAFEIHGKRLSFV